MPISQEDNSSVQYLGTVQSSRLESSFDRQRHSQNVSDHADGPHVRAEHHLLVVDHFRRDELGRAVEQPERFLRVVLPREAKIDEFDSVSGTREAQHVFWLQKKKTGNE